MPPLIQFGPSPIRARRRRPRTVFAGTLTTPSEPALPPVMQDAEAWLRPEDIQTSGSSVTGWPNYFSANPQYGFTTVVGNPTLTSINGVNAVAFPASDSLKSASQIAVPTGFTVCAVVRRMGAGVDDTVFDMHTTTDRVMLRLRLTNLLGVFHSSWVDGPGFGVDVHSVGLVDNGTSSVLAIDDNRQAVSLTVTSWGYATLGNSSVASATLGCDRLGTFAMWTRPLSLIELAEAMSFLKGLFP